MVTCANCSSEATFSYSVSKGFVIPYCSRHVPKFLQAQKFAGALNIVAPPAEAVEEEIVEKTTKKTAKTSATVEEPVVEEPPVEETPVVEEAAPSEE